jgi:polysaccharide biosynthesis/export protein ExoF
MSRKSRMITSVAGVLAFLLVLAVSLQNGRYGVAHAGESDRTASNATARVQDRSFVVAGSMVRVAAIDAASCVHPTTTAADTAALGVAIKEQVAHMTRMSAELRGLQEIVLPQQDQGLQNDAQFASALRDEKVAFAERKEAMASQIDSLNQSMELEKREIEFSQAKEAALGRQEALLQNELDNINRLISNGNATSPQKINIEQSVLQTETNRLDVKLVILKGQQEVSRIERSIADLHNQWRNETRAEFNKTKQTLAALLQQAKAASTVPAGPASSCADARESWYLIVRGAGGLLQAFPVASKTGNEASDVVVRSER